MYRSNHNQMNIQILGYALARDQANNEHIV